MAQNRVGSDKQSPHRWPQIATNSACFVMNGKSPWYSYKGTWRGAILLLKENKKE
jgi:hypothetical protein